MERVRKSLRESLSPKQRRGLMHDRFVLLKRERDLNDKERLNLDFGIYDAESPDEAQAKFIQWQNLEKLYRFCSHITGTGH